MNLFILSLCFQECAEWMFDKHVSKMILEAVQMLCCAKMMLDAEGVVEDGLDLYRQTHKNHPVSIWIRTSQENYIWTLNMIDAMHTEWKFRYGHPITKKHKAYELAELLACTVPSADKFEKTGLTPFAQAMPDEYKHEDPVEAYRRYYQSPDKQKIATWKNRSKPVWYKLITN